MSSIANAHFDANTSAEEYMAAIKSANVQCVTNYTTITGFPPDFVCTAMESDDFSVSENMNMFGDWVDGLSPETLDLVSNGITDKFKNAAAPEPDYKQDLTADRGMQMTVALS